MLCISLAQDYLQTLSHKGPSIEKQIKDRLLNLWCGGDGEEEAPKETSDWEIRGITFGYEFCYIFVGRYFLRVNLISSFHIIQLI